MSEYNPLREYTAFRYIAPKGACKCGDCQLVPHEVVSHYADEIDRITAERDALRKLFGNSESLHAIIYRHCFNALRFYLGEQRLTGDMWCATEAAAKEIADLTSSLPDADAKGES